MAAIFAGVYMAWKAWGAAVRGLVVYTDSQAAVGFLNGEALRPRIQQHAPGVARLRERIRAFAGEHGIELDLRWVKGHQQTNTVRAYLNAQCDRLAGAARTAVEADGGRKRSATAEKTSGPAQTDAQAVPMAKKPERRSRKQKNRDRRLRARERKRAKKTAKAQAPE